MEYVAGDRVERSEPDPPPLNSAHKVQPEGNSTAIGDVPPTKQGAFSETNVLANDQRHVRAAAIDDMEHRLSPCGVGGGMVDPVSMEMTAMSMGNPAMSMGTPVDPPGQKDKSNPYRVRMGDGTEKMWKAVHKDEFIDIRSLDADWWEVQEIKGPSKGTAHAQSRPRHLGVLKDLSTVLVNGGKFKWHRESAQFESVKVEAEGEKMVTLKFHQQEGDKLTAGELYKIKFMMSNKVEARKLSTRMSEVYIEQIANN